MLLSERSERNQWPRPPSLAPLGQFTFCPHRPALCRAGAPSMGTLFDTCFLVKPPAGPSMVPSSRQSRCGLRYKRATGTFLRAGFRIHNHLPPKQKKDIPFGMSFCFGGRWWIRTTEVIDDRFTVWSTPAECLMISGVFPYYSLVHCFIPLTTIVLFDSFHLFSDLFPKTLLLTYCLFIAFRERI